MRQQTILAVAVAALCGCTTVSHKEPPEGWPKLAVIEHRVGWGEMLKQCMKHVGFGSVPVACAMVRLSLNQCDVWLVEGTGPEIREHELQHCEGRDHFGSDTFAAYFERFKKARAPK